MPPSLEPPSYYSSALPTPSSIPNHDSSPQKPLNGNPADQEVPQQPVTPSPSPAASLAIYYGTDSSSPEHPSLAELCADDSISTILLGHVHGFKATNGFPLVDFGAAGCTARHADDDRFAPGLAWCPELGRQVQTCQTRGKKVFLSIGGGGSNTTLSFDDAADARRAAVMLWSLFGQGDPHGPDMRPLGEAAVDGFDFEKERSQIMPIPHITDITPLDSMDDNPALLLFVRPSICRHHAYAFRHAQELQAQPHFEDVYLHN
ncbi:hypothetical protein SLS58_009666 [Diplodia intermedia]|uniref:Chitinase n=1 Tax=Diplodia intermedia TaxID=856260 RepID=A0ABR3TAU0_9PEZI